MLRIDLAVTLLVRLSLIVAGGGLVYNGATGLHGDMLMYQVLGAGQRAMMAQFFGLHIALAVGGLSIIAFAAVGIVRAIRKGIVAPASGGMREPLTTRRILSAAGFGLGLLFGIVTLAQGLPTMTEVTVFALQGEQIKATISKFEKGPDPNEGRIAHYYFRLKDGRTFTGARPVGLNEWSRLDRAKRVDIVYLPEDPAQNDIFYPNGVQRVGYFVLTRLGLLLVGLWGVWKNLRPTYVGGTPAPEVIEPQPRPAPSDPAPTARPMPIRRDGPRAAFGRRGA